MKKYREGDFFIRSASFEDGAYLAGIERTCFPPSQAAGWEQIKGRLEHFPNHILIAYGHQAVVGFVNGFVTNKTTIEDEMYEDPSLHNEHGEYQTIFGLNVLPEYRHRGIGHLLMKAMIQQGKEENRKGIILTCKEEKIGFYESLGFTNQGVSLSVHGNTVWYNMILSFED